MRRLVLAVTLVLVGCGQSKQGSDNNFESADAAPLPCERHDSANTAVHYLKPPPRKVSPGMDQFQTRTSRNRKNQSHKGVKVRYVMNSVVPTGFQDENLDGWFAVTNMEVKRIDWVITRSRRLLPGQKPSVTGYQEFLFLW